MPRHTRCFAIERDPLHRSGALEHLDVFMDEYSVPYDGHPRIGNFPLTVPLWRREPDVVCLPSAYSGRSVAAGGFLLIDRASLVECRGARCDWPISRCAVESDPLLQRSRSSSIEQQPNLECLRRSPSAILNIEWSHREHFTFAPRIEIESDLPTIGRTARECHSNWMRVNLGSAVRLA